MSSARSRSTISAVLALVATGAGGSVPAERRHRADDRSPPPRRRRRAATRDMRDARRAPATLRVTADATGLLQARLKSRGDWDLAVFDAKTKRYVAGSAAFAGRELAEGFVTKGQRLIVQGCRFRGRAEHARGCPWRSSPTPARARGRTQVVEVSTPTRADKTRLQGLGLDLTESGDANSIDVVIAGDADARKLRAAKLRYRVKIADLGARTRANRRADRRYRIRTAGAGGSQLPSGRTTYRHLADYELELKQLAERYPKMVAPVHAALPHAPRPRRGGHRDRQERVPARGRQADLPEHGSPPRARVAGRRARARVGVRPAEELRALAAHHAAGGCHPQHRDPDRQPRRLQHLARGAGPPAERSSACSPTR